MELPRILTLRLCILSQLPGFSLHYFRVCSFALFNIVYLMVSCTAVLHFWQILSVKITVLLVSYLIN